MASRVSKVAREAQYKRFGAKFKAHTHTHTSDYDDERRRVDGSLRARTHVRAFNLKVIALTF